MEQPIFWSVLLGVAVLGGAARWRAGRPIWARRAVPVPAVWLAVAALAVLALVFHCGAMFFAPWTDAVPGARGAGEVVRAMGTASRWAYWVPAVVLVVALRRVWWPGLLVLVAALLGVGITMYGPYSLPTHLAWLAAVIVAGVAMSAMLVRATPQAAPAAR